MDSMDSGVAASSVGFSVVGFLTCVFRFAGTLCELIAIGLHVPEWQTSQANCSTSGACTTRDPCQPNYCQNGGLCQADIVANVGFTCNCAQGFRGLYCTVAIAHVPATFAVDGEDIIVRGNVAAGSTRVGFRVSAMDSCQIQPAAAIFHSNTAHSVSDFPPFLLHGDNRVNSAAAAPVPARFFATCLTLR